MSFKAANNRIQITNAAEEVVFDTDNKMPVIVQTITGTTSYGQNNNGTHNRVIGTFAEGATFFLPMHRIRGANSVWVNEGYWESGLGSKVTGAGWAAIPVLQGNTIRWTYASSFVRFNILVSGNSLILQHYQNGGNFYLNIDFKILVGRVF